MNRADTLKRDPDKVFILNYAPIFSELTAAEKDLIIQHSKVFDYRKGDIIYKQYDSPDAFYCLISGRVKIFTHTADTRKEETLEYLNCGKYFGIISLLTAEPHSVNAQAINDSKILRISKDDFHFVLKKIPKLAIDLSKTLSRRLRKKDISEKKIFESNIISVFSAASLLERTIYTINLSLSLSKETHKNVILLDFVNGDSKICLALGLPVCQMGAADKYPAIKLDTSLSTDETINKAIFKEATLGISILNVKLDVASDFYLASLNALLTYLTGHYHFVIVNLPTGIDKVVFEALNQSDSIYIVTDTDTQNLERTKELILDLFKNVKYPQEKIKILIQGKQVDKYPLYEEVVKILKYEIYATLPLLDSRDEKNDTKLSRIILEQPDSEYARVIRRIAREAGDVRVGLALSGGAAFGLAHTGVIKVLEKEGIPIDMVAGSSMGALIGAFWASGLNAKQIEEITLEYNNQKKKTFRLLMDFCFPKLSLAKGRKIRKFLEKHLDKKTFKDIKFPFKAVACNISKRQELIYDSGRLTDAVMASIAIPGIFAPTRINGDLVIDGGILEPVPVGVLVRAGIKKIIAVNVLPSPEDIAQTYALNYRRLQEERQEAKTRGFLAKIIYNLRTWFTKMFFPNIMDIIVNSIQATEYVIAEADCLKADVVIKPIVTGVDWFEFFKVESLIKKGEEQAYASLSTIKNLISE